MDSLRGAATAQPELAQREAIASCSHPAWLHMVREAERYGLPQHYVADLWKWDCQLLSDPRAPAVFAWALYDCGTHLFPAPSAVHDKPYVYGLRQVFIRQGCFTGSRHCYIWDGVALREMAVDAMFDAMEEWKEVR